MLCFNSRTPGGVRQNSREDPQHSVLFQFTHPGRGATELAVGDEEEMEVSIHAPREGCDISLLDMVHACHVSIHAPREGCDGHSLHGQAYEAGFNSRTPGGVRHKCKHILIGKVSFNSRTPGGVRQLSRLIGERLPRVSIHAPREGCDSFWSAVTRSVSEFQFTHPGRGATSLSDRETTLSDSFNSRTPGGVRPALDGEVYPLLGFQFTHPGRGATAGANQAVNAYLQFQFTHPGRGATW